MYLLPVVVVSAFIVKLMYAASALQAWLLALVQRAPLNAHNPPPVRAAAVAALRARLLCLLQTL